MISKTISKIKNKEVSIKDLVSNAIGTIEKYDGVLNAFISIDKENALKLAETYDNKVNNENVDEIYKSQPLFGIPIALKDLFSTKDLETTAGSNILKGYIPPYDATMVKRLKNAGAIIIGKLNQDAFGHGASGENSDFGSSKNPYDVSRVPGGSSSGSAVAVASDMTYLTTGTDTGGSIRNPAAFTNTVGFKPSYGLVSRYGLIAMASSLDTVSHITKTVADAALALQITAGHDVHDSTSVNNEVPNYLDTINDGVKGMKIGVVREYLEDKNLNPSIKEKMLEAIDIYKKLGAKIVDVELPNAKYALSVYYILMPSEVSSNLGRFDGIRFGHNRDTFGDEAKRRIMIGSYALSAGFYDAFYLKAQKVRTLVIEDFEKVFNNVKVVLAPVTPMLPPKLGENTDDPLKMYLMDVLTVPASIAGLPAMSVPAGFSSNGLPIGLQLIGNRYDESTLLKVAKAFEDETKYYERKPDFSEIVR